MTTLKETLQMAYDCMVCMRANGEWYKPDEAIAALQEHLAQMDEPVAVVGMSALAWVGAPTLGIDWQVNPPKPEVFMFKPLPVGTQLFIHPPAKQDEAIKKAKQEQRDEDNRILKECFAKTIEQLQNECKPSKKLTG